MYSWTGVKYLLFTPKGLSHLLPLKHVTLLRPSAHDHIRTAVPILEVPALVE